jgi:hypothetical protein
VNDAHLQEVARLSGCRVVLRGDDLILSGDVNDVERALPVAEQLVQQARIGQPFDLDDIRRTFQTAGGRPAAGLRPPAMAQRQGWPRKSSRCCWRA